MARRVLARLARANPTTVFLGTAVLVVVALVVGGWSGAAVLLALAAALAALLAMAWPGLDARGRVLRAVVLALLVVLALAQLAR